MDMIIAIDGPAGSGKSTVSRGVAKRLNLFYIDTGAMYRALTFKALEKKLCLKDEKALIDMAKNTDIELIYGRAGRLKVFVDGRDVSGRIRTPELTNNIRFVASVAGVRQEMVKMQRRIAALKKGAVLEGRDIGTVVFPGADKKFYLDADVKVRVKRRYLELKNSGQDFDIADIERDVIARDESDMKRSVAPLKKADDAVVIDTTDLAVDEVVEKIIGYIGESR